MTGTSFDAEQSYSDDTFSAVEVFRSERLKVACGYFEPGQFIPVHAPASDVAIHVRSGFGEIRDGSRTHSVKPGDVVIVEAETDRGIRADESSRLEALLVTAPPPTDTEHEPVRKGLQQGQFEPGES